MTDPAMTPALFVLDDTAGVAVAVGAVVVVLEDAASEATGFVTRALTSGMRPCSYELYKSVGRRGRERESKTDPPDDV